MAGLFVTFLLEVVIDSSQCFGISLHIRHMVRFEYVSRHAIVYDSNADEDGILATEDIPAGDGTYIQEQVLVQHDGTVGTGFRVYHARRENQALGELDEYAYHYPMDTVVALPGEVTTIRAKFNKPGEYNWHCHILSHEDHEMMRRYYVGKLPASSTQLHVPTASHSTEVVSDGSATHCQGNSCSTTTTTSSYWVTVRRSWRTFWHY
jgi:hypothetical protein